MLKGITLVVIVGFCWTLAGIVFSRVARKTINFFAFMGVSFFINMVLAWIIFPDYSVILNGSVEKLRPLALVMMTSGILNSIGITSMKRAMKKGHHGIVWTIAQSALLIPDGNLSPVYHPAFQILAEKAKNGVWLGQVDDFGTARVRIWLESIPYPNLLLQQVQPFLHPV